MKRISHYNRGEILPNQKIVSIMLFQIFSIVIALLFGSYSTGFATTNKIVNGQLDFKPSDLAGNVLWLDGSDVDGDSTPGGSFVNDVWIDKSTAKNADAKQNISILIPTIVRNGLNELDTIKFAQIQHFDINSDSFGMLREVNGSTLISVLKPLETGNGQRVIMISTNSSFKGRAGLSLFDSVDYDQPGSYLGGDGDFGLTGRVLDSDTFQRIEGGNVEIGLFQQYTGLINYANATMELFVNGISRTKTTQLANPGLTSNTDSANIRIGADADLELIQGSFRGEIAELIVYNRVLGDDERGIVEEYLLNKWKYNESVLAETTSTSQQSSVSSTTDTTDSPGLTIFYLAIALTFSLIITKRHI